MRTWFLAAFAFAVPATSATIHSGCVANVDFRIQISAWDDIGSEYTALAGRQLASFRGCAAVNMSFRSDSLREVQGGLASTSRAALDAGSARMLLRILTDASVLEFDDSGQRPVQFLAVLATSRPAQGTQAPGRPFETAPIDLARAAPASAGEHGGETQADANIRAVLAVPAAANASALSSAAAAPPDRMDTGDTGPDTELAGSAGADSVPEPATVVLAAVGLAVLRAFAGRRRPRSPAR